MASAFPKMHLYFRVACILFVEPQALCMKSPANPRRNDRFALVTLWMSADYTVK